MGLFRLVFTLLDFPGLITLSRLGCASLGLSELIWVSFSLTGHVCAYLGLSGMVKGCMGSGLVWACLGLFGLVWAFLGLSWIVWDCQGLSGFFWTCLGLSRFLSS
jgi:hypothetical protein